MLKIAVKTLFTLTLLGMLSGCGFQLRGVTPIPDELRTLHLQGNERSAMYQTVERTLKSSGVSLVDSAQQAPYTIELISDSLDRRSASLNTRAKVEEYELRARLRYQILDSEGEVAIPETELYTERTYDYDENSVNAKEAEEALLRKEMRQTLAGQLVRRYLSLAEQQSR
ncbi:LPS assembly lipoprotein LptE [Motiliproteus sp.]|uniref:LPS-assembly lipoprotein LptE n=1 Tax=Motiliproteus sp. TaxID=1898955 RepID=UPI003BAB708D